jgi:pimeloyl-ACP methyl ester carboxylesterase
MKTVRLKLFYLLVFLSSMAINTYAQQDNKANTYVLIHGAFHGGWCWQMVAKELRSKGNSVYTPTLSGQGERKNTLDTNINLETHIQDVVNTIVMEDLHNVILVGHSYAGAVIAGVADRIPGRLSKLVFLDALIVENGQSANDLNPADVVEGFKTASIKNDNGLSIPILSSKFFGVTDSATINWADLKLTNQPYRTFSQKLVLRNPYGNNVPITYIACTGPELRAIQRSVDIAKNKKGWKYLELNSGHDAMLIKPVRLAELLLN